jgi:hypothetical protein
MALWFYGADYNLADQLAYLNGIPKVKEEHLRRMIEGKEILQEFAQRARQVEIPKYFEPKPGGIPDFGLRQSPAAGRQKPGGALPFMRRGGSRRER